MSLEQSWAPPPPTGSTVNVGTLWNRPRACSPSRSRAGTSSAD